MAVFREGGNVTGLMLVFTTLHDYSIFKRNRGKYFLLTYDYRYDFMNTDVTHCLS